MWPFLLLFPVPTLSFPQRLRLSHAREFEAVYAARLRKPKGPLIVFARANQLPHHRLGLSIGRVVGGSVRRNRLKRHIREAFRLLQHVLPRHASGSYDMVVAARRHDELSLVEYTQLLTEAVAQLHKDHTKRAERQSSPAIPPASKAGRPGGGER
jgi:ribonuclease P protein component